MAFGHHKFVIGKGQESAEAVIAYLADPQARGDYYSEGGQAVLLWIATERLQKLFALGGPIVEGRATMRMLLEGRHPLTGEVIRRWGPNGTMVGAIDVTLSPAPKSVSVLWALADVELRHELERMVWDASALAIAELLSKPLVRQRFGPGKNDVRPVVMADIIGTQVLHTTARLSERGDGIPDPQLHVHSLLFGALDERRRLRALSSREILRYQKEIDGQAQAILAEMLRQRGFELERRTDKRGRVTWELAEIPRAVLRQASSRRAEITAEGPGTLREEYRAWCRERYGAEREPQGQAWKDFLAAHRGPKGKLEGRELRAAWGEQYETVGWGREEARAYAARGARRVTAGIAESDARQEDVDQFREEFLRDLCMDHALVPRTHIDAMAMEKAKGLIDETTALTAVGAMYRDGDLLVAPDGRVTTLRVVAEEQRARRAAQQLEEAPPAPPASDEEIDQALGEAEDQGLPFDQHQEKAIRLATSGARFVSIGGPAGTGKGLASSAMTRIWQSQGRRVIALAVAGRTAQQAGHDARSNMARTIDGFLASVERGSLAIGPETVLLVDEAAMIDHARYAALLETAARSGVQFVQVGDDRQLSAVERGGLWTLIHEEAAARGLTAELRVVRRAKEAAEAQAWTDVRAGRVLEAMKHWDGRGRLRLYNSRAEMRAGMVSEWWADRGQGVILVDTSNAERDQLNRLAQERRVEAGELGAVAVQLENGREVRAGDEVLITEPYEVDPWRPGMSRAERARRRARIENGTTATVAAVDEESGRVELVLHEPAGDRRVELDRTVPVELSYARHIAKGQGMTAEGAGQVGVSGGTDREHFYTMVSRARWGAVVHAERGIVAEMAAPRLGKVTARQEHVLSELGIELEESWTWLDASLEIDARSGEPLGGWALNHMRTAMEMEPLLAAHLVAEGIERRQGEKAGPVDVEQVAPELREIVAEQRQAEAPTETAAESGEEASSVPGSESPEEAAWRALMADVARYREEAEARESIAEQVAREGAKEAVGDRPMAEMPELDDQQGDQREVRQARRDGDLLQGVHHDLHRTWWAQAERQPLQELPLPLRDPDLESIRFADGREVERGQVIHIQDPESLPGFTAGEVEPGELGVVLGCHRGGVTWDYATVELVGGRRIEVWQTAEGIEADPSLTPSVVLEAVPRPDQRDPVSMEVLELTSGVRLMSGDRVRLTEAAFLEGAGEVEAGTEARILDVQRQRHNRAIVELTDGREGCLYTSSAAEIVQPAEEPRLGPVRKTEAGQGARSGRRVEILPASNPVELMARWQALDRMPRALAMYDSLGQLDISQTPEEQAARLWLADQDAHVVVEGQDQALAVRAAIEAEREGQEPAESAEPRIWYADAAYEARAQAEREGVEHEFPARAYVIADPRDGAALARAASVARESHLVIGLPDSQLAEQMASHSRELAQAQQEAVQEVEPSAGRAAEHTREVAVEAGVEAERQAREAGRQSEPTAGRE